MLNWIKGYFAIALTFLAAGALRAGLAFLILPSKIALDVALPLYHLEAYKAYGDTEGPIQFETTGTFPRTQLPGLIALVALGIVLLRTLLESIPKLKIRAAKKNPVPG